MALPTIVEDGPALLAAGGLGADGDVPPTETDVLHDLSRTATLSRIPSQYISRVFLSRMTAADWRKYERRKTVTPAQWGRADGAASQRKRNDWDFLPEYVFHSNCIWAWEALAASARE
jgi:hypothetical protein